MASPNCLGQCRSAPVGVHTGTWPHDGAQARLLAGIPGVRIVAHNHAGLQKVVQILAGEGYHRVSEIFLGQIHSSHAQIWSFSKSQFSDLNISHHFLSIMICFRDILIMEFPGINTASTIEPPPPHTLAGTS